MHNAASEIISNCSDKPWFPNVGPFKTGYVELPQVSPPPAQIGAAAVPGEASMPRVLTITAQVGYSPTLGTV
ncbi:hypothetical protein GCM10009715_10230 [Paeniglutamicibacter psychrophenolicus]